MSVRVSGFKFAALREGTRKNIAEALNEGADSMISLAKQLAPVDTGAMRDGIAQTEKASESSLRAVMESPADYSVFVEYGTISQDAQPFFTPAFESARRQVNNGLKRVLQFGNLRGV